VEYHPRLNFNNLKIQEGKIILGSFPTWSLSDSVDNTNTILSEKLEMRNKTGDIPFFYGSSKNLFWSWYKVCIDPDIELSNINDIIISLNKNQIGITDVILSCKRNGRSALDKHLTQRKYNHSFFYYPEVGCTIKILCTSKGVMNNMLLNKNFFMNHKRLSIDRTLSHSFQNEFLKGIDGNINLLKTPFVNILNVENGGRIECLSIPSPGSPYRKLTDFGLNSSDLNSYLNTFIENAFKWFNGSFV
jgi:hypothetical protein